MIDHATASMQVEGPVAQNAVQSPTRPPLSGVHGGAASVGLRKSWMVVSSLLFAVRCSERAFALWNRL